MNSVQDLHFFFFPSFSLSASTYNCAGCCFTWVRSYELVIMIHLQQNSNELHPWGKARRVYIGSDSSSSSTDSWLPVGCRWCEKCSLSRGLGLTTRMLNLAVQAWKQNSCYPIAGKFTVVPLRLVELHKKMWAFSRTTLFFGWGLVPSDLATQVTGKL